MNIQEQRSDIQEQRSEIAELQNKLLVELIKEIDNDDENIGVLEKAVEYYCSSHEKCEGYKTALYLQLEDECNHHHCWELENHEHTVKLEKILSRNTDE